MAEESPDSLQITPTDDVVDWNTFEADIAAQPDPEPAPNAEDVVVVPAPAAPAPAPAPTPAAADPTEQAAPVELPADDLKRVRLDRMSPVDQRTVSILARNPDLGIEQAAALARQQLGFVVSPTAAHQPQEEPLHEEAPEMSLGEELAEVQRQLDEASTEGGTGAVFDTNVRKLVADEARLLAEIAANRALENRDARNAAESESHQFASENDASIAAAEAAYPDLANAESSLALAVETEIATMLAVDAAVKAGDTSALADPDMRVAYSEFEHPRYAERLAHRLASQLGIKAAGDQSAATTPTVGHPSPAQSTPPASKPQMLPVSGHNGSARVEIAPATPEDAYVTNLNAIEDADDWSAMDAALSGGKGDVLPTVRFA